MENCNAIIKFGDDEGDNTTTFHCNLLRGHKGSHKETGNMYSKQIYKLIWRNEINEPDWDDSRFKE